MTGRTLRTRISPLVAATLLAAEAGAAQSSISLADDRGEPLSTAVSACFHVTLKESCVDVAPGAALRPPDSFESVRVEGEVYGPATFRRADAIASTPEAPLRVPRKATVRVRGLDAEVPATVTFFSAGEQSDMRRPLSDHELKAKEATFRVPAGRVVVAIGQARLAPDLRVLELAPGGNAEISFVRRSGWSLLLRATDLDEARPVGDARVRVGGMQGFSGASPPRDTVTDSAGFAVVAGIDDGMVRAALTHPHFVRREESGLLAPAGTFAYHAVPLERGGALRALVRLEGRPAAGIVCRVLRYPRSRQPGEAPEVFASTAGDRQGLCASPPLAAGAYLLEVTEPSRRIEALDAFTIAEGQDTERELDLDPIRITGTARQGSRAAAGFRVHASSAEARIPAATRSDAVADAVVDEEGGYELTLWAPGDYYLGLETPQGVPAKWKLVEFLIGDEVVDFQLDEATVFGRVEDAEGRPLPTARVHLSWRGRDGSGVFRIASTGEGGEFSFPMETDGPVDLRAMRQGYTPSEPLLLRFVSGQPLGPLVLVLRKEKSLRGTVVAAAGAPVPRAAITIQSATAAAHRGSATSGEDGSFEVVLPAGAAHQGFVSGPGCPLTPFAVPAVSDDATAELRIACAAAPASLAMRVLDPAGTPVPGAGLLLRTGGFVVPADVLARHLSALGMPAQTDASGGLVVAAVAGGTYDVYLAAATNQDLVALGTHHGHLGTFSLAPSSLLQVEARLAGELPVVEAPPRSSP